MYSVVGRIKTFKQPRGGLIPPKTLTETILSDGNKLSAEENINPGLVGTAVEYLTRYLNDPKKNKESAFAISLIGARGVGEETQAKKLLGGITGLDRKSIINACKLVGYDVVYRAGMMAYRPVADINPDSATWKNIEIMVNRSLTFFQDYGPVVKDGFTFEGAYTPTISSGDGDFLTKDTLWDFKVSRNKPTKDHTLQVLTYLLLGQRSIHPEFQSITSLGIFNPRLNVVYLIKLSDVPSSVIELVLTEVIGYPPRGY